MRLRIPRICPVKKKMCFVLVTFMIFPVVLAIVHFVKDTNITPKYKSSLVAFLADISDEGLDKDVSSKSATQGTNQNLNLCPMLSPNLKGATKFSFDPALTLEQVSTKNPSVEYGMYRPESCQAQQKVAIIIPFRNRERHLLYMLNHLHPFLQRQQLEYGIYIIHQARNEKFNRAKLLNVGYLEALKEMQWDCFIFHDVDLLPENDFNLYLCDTEPKQLVVVRNTTNYNVYYKYYFGGATALTQHQFAKVNGYSNNYWGWGGEDDDLRKRVILHKMKVVKPAQDIAKYTMIMHKRDKGNEVNSKRMQQLNRVPKVFKADGLNSCSYKLLSIEHNPLYININVDIGRPNS
ncbi:beta-1,4-galactosyltransferase 4-like isoform X1 [Pelobates fuscus]|uniref:beta-1,4-galactosyltransferase 4-like isoform X1 n=1 Tax=Pelobates fuscus TaxID=191477 RepID=UPI002FE48949